MLFIHLFIILYIHLHSSILNYYFSWEMFIVWQIFPEGFHLPCRFTWLKKKYIISNESCVWKFFCHACFFVQESLFCVKSMWQFFSSFQNAFVGLRNLGATCYVNTLLQVTCKLLYMCMIWNFMILMMMMILNEVQMRLGLQGASSNKLKL